MDSKLAQENIDVKEPLYRNKILRLKKRVDK
jgi:hypothetical protein